MRSEGFVRGPFLLPLKCIRRPRELCTVPSTIHNNRQLDPLDLIPICISSDKSGAANPVELYEQSYPPRRRITVRVILSTVPVPFRPPLPIAARRRFLQDMVLYTLAWSIRGEPAKIQGVDKSVRDVGIVRIRWIRDQRRRARTRVAVK